MITRKKLTAKEKDDEREIDEGKEFSRKKQTAKGKNDEKEINDKGDG